MLKINNFNLGCGDEDKELSPTFKVCIQRKSEIRFLKTGFLFRKVDKSERVAEFRSSGFKRNLGITKFRFFDDECKVSPIHRNDASLYSDKSRCKSARKFSPFKTNSFVNFKASGIRIQMKQNIIKELSRKNKGPHNRNMIVIGKKCLDIEKTH